eukprot:2449193-Pyramimonas_sp.AAC.1
MLPCALHRHLRVIRKDRSVNGKCLPASGGSAAKIGASRAAPMPWRCLEGGPSELQQSRERAPVRG